jgi:hypothetical protein
MVRSTLIVATAAAMIALSMFEATEARAVDFGGNGAYCHWYMQQAWNSGDEYWWDRWRRCLRGDDWDRPRQTPRPRGKAGK